MTRTHSTVLAFLFIVGLLLFALRIRPAEVQMRDEIESAKEGKNVMRGLRAKQDALKDFEKWTAPLVHELEELKAPPLVILGEA